MSVLKVAQAAGVSLRNLLVGANVRSLGQIGTPRQLVSVVNELLFLQLGLTRRRGLPQKNVFEVLPTTGVERVVLGELQRRVTPYGEPWFHDVPSYTVDIVSLCLICQILKPKVVFEIGTLNGYTTYHFALNTPEASRVYTLDLPRDQSVAPALKTTMVDEWMMAGHAKSQGHCFDGTAAASKITCLFGDSARFDYSPYRGQVELFFIDGAHSYEYVRADTLNALNCCRPGSVIAWHDFGRTGVNGVSRWLQEFARDHEVYSVPGGSLAFTVVGAKGS